MPEDGTLQSDRATRRLEPQLMSLLAYLASRPGVVVSRQDILESVWKGTVVTEDALTGSIYQLRRALGDEARRPRYIETVHKRGYRLLVAPQEPPQALPESIHRPRSRAPRSLILAGVLLVLGLGVVGVWMLASSTGPGPRVRSLAVLPLKSLSGQPEDGALSEGVTAALTTELAKAESLRVISPGSMLRYRESGKEPRAIARELGVDAVLEGTLTRSGQRVRIDARLVDASRDAYLWAESYDRDLTDLLHLQGEIARSISRAVETRLASSGPAPARRQVASRALEAYLKGRALLDQRSPEALRQAKVYFEQALAVAPELAEASAGLADVYMLMCAMGLGTTAELYPPARAAAVRAIDLDPGLAEAHTSLAAILGFFERDAGQAEQEFRRAIALQPSYAQAHRWYAFLLAALGRRAESIAEARMAASLDPLYLPGQRDLATVLFMARDYDEGVRALTKALELDPAFVDAHLSLSWAHALQGKAEEAYAAYRRGLEATKVEPRVLERLDGVFAREGLPGVFRSHTRYLEGLPVRTPGTEFNLAVAYAFLGDRDRAFEKLERAYRDGHPELIFLPVSPLMDRLRSDPRFAPLAAKVGLTASPVSPARSAPPGFPQN